MTDPAGEGAFEVLEAEGKASGYSRLDWFRDGDRRENQARLWALRQFIKLLNTILLPLSLRYCPLLFGPLLKILLCWTICHPFWVQNLWSFLLTIFKESFDTSSDLITPSDRITWAFDSFSIFLARSIMWSAIALRCWVSKSLVSIWRMILAGSLSVQSWIEIMLYILTICTWEWFHNNAVTNFFCRVCKCSES